MNDGEKLLRFLALNDFDEYMEKYESFHGLAMGKDTFRQEMHLMESDERHTHRQKERILLKRKRDLVKTLRRELESLRDEAVQKGPWREDEGEELLTFTYRYPDGKKGDVAHYLAEQLGKVKQLDEELYQAEVSSSDKQFLEIVVFPARSFLSRYDYSQADQTAWYLIRSNRMAELEYKMWYINYYTQEYRNLRSITDPVLRNLLSGYHDKLAHQRDAIYEKLILDGAANARWVSEQKAFSIVKKHFPDAVFQYQAAWLGGQRLDIFIPSRGIGIEYQGLQHTEAVEFFGGEEGLREQRMQDKRKWIRCRQNNVRLLYWDSQVPLTEEYFMAELYPRMAKE